MKAKNLLYGPRRIGSGPQGNQSVSFDDLVASLQRDKLPYWLKNTSADVELYGEANTYENGDLGSSITSVLLKGLSDDVIEISLYRERGLEVVAFGYERDYSASSTISQPGSTEERLFVKALSDHLPETAKIEFSTLNSDQLQSFFDNYPNYSIEQLRFASSSFINPNESEHDIIQSLANTFNEQMSRFQSLQQILASPGGREMIISLNDETTIYFEAPLKQFAEGF